MWNKIIMPCPVCVQKRNKYSIQTWTHGGVCGGDLYLDEEGYVHCLKCGKSAHIKSMYFSCDTRYHEKSKATRIDIASAISMLKLDNSLESLKWVKSVIENL